MPSFDMHREVRLAAYPAGAVSVDDLAIVDVPTQYSGAAELLVRNQAFLIAPSLRSLLAADARPEAGVPFPPVRVGETLGATAIGVVVRAPDGCAFAPGDSVLHFRGWREFAVVPLEECIPLSDSFPKALVQLGHGWTAYAALTRGAPVQAGETVFISSAGGAIGSMASQIARLLGAARVIGSTSSAEKARRLVVELGLDAAITRAGAPFAEQLSAAAPDGIDVMVDTVGGEQLQAGLALARNGARFALLGTLAQDLAESNSVPAPVTVDAVQFLARRITMTGYSADDDDGTGRLEWEHRCAEWMGAGALRFPHTIIHGLERAPQALADATSGRYIGAVIVQIGD